MTISFLAELFCDTQCLCLSRYLVIAAYLSMPTITVTLRDHTGAGARVRQLSEAVGLRKGKLRAAGGGRDTAAPLRSLTCLQSSCFLHRTNLGETAHLGNIGTMENTAMETRSSVPAPSVPWHQEQIQTITSFWCAEVKTIYILTQVDK